MEKSRWCLIIGLGNCDPHYVSTYHNAGFLAWDYFLKTAETNCSCVKKGKKKLFEFFEFRNKKTIIFVKPATLMNESGAAVATSLRHFQIKTEKILLAHDDSDIAIGKFKFSFGRGAAGHHGVESVVKNLGTQNFWRLRIGIRPADLSVSVPLPRLIVRKKAGDFVLKKITAADKIILEEVFQKAALEIFDF